MGLGPTLTMGFVDENGNWTPVTETNPLPIEGDGGGGATATWDTLEGKPPVIAAGDTQAQARSAIGAGTSNLAIGTTASTAKAGNWTPAVADVTGLQAELDGKIDKTSVTGLDSGTELPASAPEGTVFFLYTAE